MQLTDSKDIMASPDVVWAAILNPEVLKECVPGCESLTGSVEDGFEAVVAQKVGPVSARFTGIVKLSDIVVGKAVTITGEGKGGPAGYAKGGAQVTLEAIEGGTRLSYTVDASVGGKIAQLGSRIIDSFAKKLADKFFENFQEAIEGPDEEEVASDEAPKKGWFKRLIGA
jgi:hypothetical protein